MAEALGVTANILTLLQLSDTVIRYLNEVKNASKDCNQFMTEISATSGVLSSLQKLVAEQSSLDDTKTKIESIQDGVSQLHVANQGSASQPNGLISVC